MTKQKTKKSVLRRFKITSTGKVLRRQGFRRHLNVKMNANRKRRLGRMIETKEAYAEKVRRVLNIQ